jgi:hypothetical protein
VYDNGTIGSQCQNQHEGGWHCNHLYSTDTCRVGYVCDADKGQCTPDPKGGTGDTKANCEAHCKPRPTGLSICNTKTSTCEPCKDYCSTNEDCPGSYCQAGLCHGSTCQQNATCTEKCSADTPAILIGVWRGVQIQTDFGAGEYDFKFQSKKDGPQVLFRPPQGATSWGSVLSDYSAGGRDIQLSFTAGPLSGTTLSGAFDPWEPSDETEQFAFYFGAPNDDKPDTIHTAMNGTGATVYTMSKCGHGSVNCDFDSVFTTASTVKPLFMELVKDPCNANADCSSCIGDSSKLCGWCSQNVVYKDGTPGKQCAGFDKTGKPLGWQCSGLFSKYQCQDYGCDWTNMKAPKCMPGKGTQTQSDCSKTCKAPTPQFQCDASKKMCTPCDMKYCTSDKQCPGSYCNIHGTGPWSCHGGVPSGCMDEARCNSVAKTNCSSADTTVKCDGYSGKCIPVPAGTPGAQTQYECEHHCKGARPTGTYRAVNIAAKFKRGEYDFTFYDDNTLHWRDPSGLVTVASLKSGAEAVEKDAFAVDGTVTKSGDPQNFPVGTKVYSIMKRDEQGNDGIGKFIFHGFDLSPVASFADAMSKTEWIMVGCKTGENCDFSKVQVN